MKRKPGKRVAPRSPGRSRRSSALGEMPPAAFTLHLVSDETGNLASHMINAILTQFPRLEVRQVRHVFQDEVREIAEGLRGIRKGKDIVLHAVVDPELKRAVGSFCRRKGVPHFDLTGSLVQFIADHTKSRPVVDHARLHETNAGYFQRIEAMEFTAQHDDGRRLDTVREAEIILVGISRVSKSPTSTFLGFLGYKVANVSIAPETGVPGELTGLEPRTILLTCRPQRLKEIRERRFEGFRVGMRERGLGDLDYCDLRKIVVEVEWAESEFRRRGIPVIDTTYQTVEQTAAAVLQTLKIHHRDFVYA